MQVSRSSTIAAPSVPATVTRSTRHRFLARPAALGDGPSVGCARDDRPRELQRATRGGVRLRDSALLPGRIRLRGARPFDRPRPADDPGGSASFPALVDPLFTSVAWLQNDPEIAYRITQGIHALAISLAAVPVYFLGRRLALPLRDTLLAAAATVALPSFVFSAYVTADAFGVTVALCAVLAGVVALERPTARTQSVFLVLAVVATLTRVQYVFLPAAFVVAALVVERGNLRSAARLFRPTLVVLAVLTALTLLAGPHRLVGLYDGIFEFSIDPNDIGRWVVVNTFLLALATGAVVLPGAIGGLVGALGRRAGRAERGFATFAIVSLLALLLEAAIFSANGTHGFFERYLMLAGPLLILGLCLVARSARGRIFGMAAGAVLLVAVMRLPLSGYAAEGGKRDSPLLGGVFWLEDRLGVGAGSQLVAFSAAGLILCSIVLLKVSKAVVPICLVIAIGAGAAASFAGASYDVARAHDARSDVPAGRSELGRHADLGPATMLLAAGANPPVASTHLFWNTTLEHVVRLEGAERIDSFATGKATIAADGTVTVDGLPVTGPVLVEEYGAAAQLEHARLDRKDDRHEPLGTCLAGAHREPHRRALPRRLAVIPVADPCLAERPWRHGDDAVHPFATRKRPNPDGRGEGSRRPSKHRRARGRGGGREPRRRPQQAHRAEDHLQDRTAGRGQPGRLRAGDGTGAHDAQLGLKLDGVPADSDWVNTIAVTTSRVPRPVVIAVVALVAAFVALMVVRVGVFGGSSDSTSAATPVAPSTPSTTPAKTFTKPAATTPKVVLLPGLPASVAHALRYSKVAVVSLYVGQAQGDRAVVTEVRKGARSVGAGFVAINVGNDKQAESVTSFAGSVSAPTMLVVRRPGKIVAQFSGPVESAVIAQAAHNAGARR